jgi:hypothetical protein
MAKNFQPQLPKISEEIKPVQLVSDDEFEIATQQLDNEANEKKRKQQELVSDTAEIDKNKMLLNRLQSLCNVDICKRVRFLNTEVNKREKQIIIDQNDLDKLKREVEEIKKTSNWSCCIKINEVEDRIDNAERKILQTRGELNPSWWHAPIQEDQVYGGKRLRKQKRTMKKNKKIQLRKSITRVNKKSYKITRR